MLGAMLADGDIIEVQVEGWKAVHYALGSDAEVLNELGAGRVPKAWTPLETTTTEEVVFLAPLDPVSARGRAKVLFGFDYVWEVYKPEHQRKFGYYTLPVLWGDRLVARFDSKLDRTTNTFVILGLWLEDEASATMRHLRRHWRVGLRDSDISRREQAGCDGDPRAAAPPARRGFQGSDVKRFLPVDGGLASPGNGITTNLRPRRKKSPLSLRHCQRRHH